MEAMEGLRVGRVLVRFSFKISLVMVWEAALGVEEGER